MNHRWLECGKCRNCIANEVARKLIGEEDLGNKILQGNDEKIKIL